MAITRPILKLHSDRSKWYLQDDDVDDKDDDDDDKDDENPKWP